MRDEIKVNSPRQLFYFIHAGNKASSNYYRQDSTPGTGSKKY